MSDFNATASCGQFPTASRTLRGAAILRRTGVALAAAVETAMLWLERRQQRRALMRLDGRLLKDIGVSRADAEREAAKLPWQP